MAVNARRAVLAFLLCFWLCDPARGQVGVIIVPKEPGQAEALAQKAGRLLRSVRRSLKSGPLDAAQKAILRARLRELLDEGRKIKSDSRCGLLLSTQEQGALDTSLGKVKLVCSWLKRNALADPEAFPLARSSPPAGSPAGPSPTSPAQPRPSPVKTVPGH